MTPRAVFDCMVFAQAVANSEGPAFACFEMARSGRIVLCISSSVVAEVGEVLGRSKLRNKLPNLTSERAEAFLEDVASFAISIDDVPEHFRYERDPKDEPYLNPALAAGARYLVSRDGDLLDLMNDEGFRDTYLGLAVVDPPALLRELS